MEQTVTYEARTARNLEIRMAHRAEIMLGLQARVLMLETIQTEDRARLESLGVIL